MRNLKRALSLALAAVMVLGMMVVGAGAAYKDFTDIDEIKHDEAVKTLVTLNVIAGKEDGSYFDPTGSLTRAEMAKLVVYVLHGGKEPVLGTKSTPTYSDIKGNWAEAYIEYCSSVGIIAGDGAGRFNPTGTLTGSQAAKMLLVAMNYDAKVFKFTGNNWEIDVNREANQAGLYDDLDGLNPSAVISRDDAAQMVYNAILAGTMEKTWTQDMTDGTVSQHYELNPSATLFKTKFNGTIYEGVLTTSGKYSINGSGAKDRLAINAEKVDNSTTGAGNYTFREEDNDLTNLLGRYVKILYNSKNEVVYGVYPVNAKNKTLVETTRDKAVIDGTKLKLDGVKYDYDNAANRVIVDGTVSGSTIATYFAASPAPAMGDKVVAISNDGDEKIDLVLVETMAVAKVNYVGSDSFSINKLAGTRAQGADALNTYTNANQKFEDVTVDKDSIAKDAFVLVGEDYYTGKDKYSVIETVSGTITGTKSGEWLIDGDWYKVYAGDTSDTLTADNKSGDTVDFIAYGSVVYYAKKTSGANSIASVAMVLSAGNTGSEGNITAGSEKAKLLFADGSKSTVEVVDSNGDSTPATSHVGKLVTFEKTSSGKYILTAVSGSNKAGYTGYVSDTTDVSGSGTSIAKVGTTDIADDAVVFVMKWVGTDTDKPNAGNDGKILTGKEAKTLLKTDYDGKTVQALTSASNGFTYVKAMTLFNDNPNTTLPSTFDGKSYGYLVADAYKTYEQDNTTWYRNYTIWDGTDTKTVKEDSNGALGNLKAGAVITYNEAGDGIVKDVKLVNPVLTQVDGYDAVANKMSVAAGLGATKITSDTVILYVNSASKTGQASGTISIANDTAAAFGTIDDKDQANVRVLASTATGKTDEWAFILVDVNNTMKAGPVMSYAAGDAAVDTVAEINTLLTNGNDVAITGNVTLAGSAITVPAGRSLTIDGNFENTTQTVIVNGALNVTGTLTATGVTLNNTDAFLEVGGTTTAAVTVTNGSAELAAVIGNVSAANASTVKAGAVTGTLTLTDTAKAEVASVSGAITGAANTELIITGAVTTLTAPAGKVIFKQAPTGKITLNAASVVTFESSIDVQTVLANDATAGAKVTFTVAPTNLYGDAAGGFYSDAGATTANLISTPTDLVGHTYTANAAHKWTPAT